MKAPAAAATAPGSVAAVNSEERNECRVYWGHSGCGLPRGHDSGQDIREHRQLEPSDQKATAETAFLFGEDLNEAERALIAELW